MTCSKCSHAYQMEGLGEGGMGQALGAGKEVRKEVGPRVPGREEFFLCAKISF